MHFSMYVEFMLESRTWGLGYGRFLGLGMVAIPTVGVRNLDHY